MHAKWFLFLGFVMQLKWYFFQNCFTAVINNKGIHQSLMIVLNFHTVALFWIFTDWNSFISRQSQNLKILSAVRYFK